MSGRLYIMRRYSNGAANYAPLYVHSFRLIAPRKFAEARTLHQRYQALSDIDNTPERLRWQRHSMGLMQKEVAARIGVSCAVYVDMETGAVDHCPAAVADRLSALYGVPVERLLDGYNLFLYRGQTAQIREYRKRTGLSRKAFARLLGVSDSSIRAWESGRVQVSRQSWEKHFKDKL